MKTIDEAKVERLRGKLHVLESKAVELQEKIKDTAIQLAGASCPHEVGDHVVLQEVKPRPHGPEPVTYLVTRVRANSWRLDQWCLMGRKIRKNGTPGASETLIRVHSGMTLVPTEAPEKVDRKLKKLPKKSKA